MGTFKPTDEQLAAVEFAKRGDDLAIEALAGAGKTSTLRLVAEAMPDTTFAYVAFNKKIVQDGRKSFGGNVQCSTAHSLAMQSVGRTLRHKLDSNRMSNRQLADALGLDLDTPMVFGDGDDTIEIPAERQAGLAWQTVERFCRGADEKISSYHVPLQRGLDEPGKRGNQRALADRLVPLAEKIWIDVQDPHGRFRFSHNHYLKVWQLSGPRIAADAILFDEAQDANPLMMSIVQQQDHAQKIWVGDANQMIYAWNGAVNAMQVAEVDNRTLLSRSFRFGPEIAEAANEVLALLGDVRVIGSGPAGKVHEIDSPDVWLGRTNAAVVSRALYEMDQGRKVCVQGGTREIVSFAEGALALMSGGKTSHPELACFPHWAAVQVYAQSDDGQDLRSLVHMVDDFTPEVIIGSLSDVTDNPRYADVTVSTAHKCKGAEWGSVAMLGDFPVGDDLGIEDLRLRYVAVTRAMRELDVSALAEREAV